MRTKSKLGKLYGDFAGGNAVEAMQVKGVNHLTIIWSAEAAQNIVQWLDGISGIKHVAAPNVAEPRLPLTILCMFLFLLLLIPIGTDMRGTGDAKRASSRRERWMDRDSSR